MTYLLLMALKTSVVFILATAVAFALRRQAASFRHLVWSVALLSALVIPFIPAHNEVSIPIEIQSEAAPVWLPAIVETRAQNAQPSAASPEPGGLIQQTASIRPQDIAIAVWSFGFAGVALTTLLGLFRARRLVNESRECKAAEDHGGHLRASDSLTVPVALWAGRFYVVFPSSFTDWSQERLQNVLAHETAHLQRWDPVWLLVGRFACAVHWFNPLAWLALAKMRDEAELAADDAVLRTGATASGYAADLMALSRPERVRTAALSLGRPMGLARRIRRLVQEAPSRRGVSARVAAGLAAAGVFAVAPLASMRLVATPQEPEGLASVRMQITESTTPSGLKVSFLATSDGHRAWDSRWKWVDLPTKLPVSAHPTPGSRLLVFTFTQPAVSNDQYLSTGIVPVTMDGAKLGSGVGTALPMKDGKVQIVTGYWVRPVPPAGVADMDVKIGDGPWKVLAQGAVSSSSQPMNGKLYVRDATDEAGISRYDRNGPKHFLRVRIPAGTEEKEYQVRLFDKHGAVVWRRMLTSAGTDWLVNSYLPVDRIGRVVVLVRPFALLHFSGLPLNPPLK